MNSTKLLLSFFVFLLLSPICFGTTQEQIDATPATNPDSLAEMEKSNRTYKVSGEIPVKNAGKEAYGWQMELISVCDSFGQSSDFRNNQVPGGPITHCTPSTDGYIFVGLNPNFHLIDQDFDIIIDSLTKISKEKGIQNIPIVIGISNQPIPAVSPSPRLFPATRPSYFENLTNNDSVLMTYGNVPKKPRGIEAYEWDEKLTEISSDVTFDSSFSNYKVNNGGFIEWVRVDYEFIAVQVSDSYPLNSSELNESMVIITEIGKEHGVKNVPIVVYGNRELFTVEEEKKPMSIPGFNGVVSVFALLGLIGIIRMKK
ncbi:hypothetical protein MsAg5_12760 [Methanosarcinaceae archaeon Ag5]|uniref:Uncharacterized protein n=1 Tax=Methanolapillus africanus TaxID=3028297 RepID=A0AAE4MKN9_9EURY|nr:hypothetical protein [Methanosarcinaceae archaeon Ag5]